jgi:hypothetical protein
MLSAPNADSDQAASLTDLRDALLAANINPKTGLSTDYLNHFNEIVMMIELYPTAPDLKDEILAWRTLNYRGHFEASGFRAKALALEGYELAADALKKRLDVIVAEIDTVLLQAQNAIASERQHGEASAVLTESSEAVELLIARASALINGHTSVQEASADDAQAAVDALFGG